MIDLGLNGFIGCAEELEPWKRRDRHPIISGKIPRIAVRDSATEFMHELENTLAARSIPEWRVGWHT
jgi:hypothetical protein